MEEDSCNPSKKMEEITICLVSQTRVQNDYNIGNNIKEFYN